MLLQTSVTSIPSRTEIVSHSKRLADSVRSRGTPFVSRIANASIHGFIESFTVGLNRSCGGELLVSEGECMAAAAAAAVVLLR